MALRYDPYWRPWGLLVRAWAGVAPRARPHERERMTAGPAWSEPRVALVTGGAAGIGRAEAVALAEAGADVAILAHTDLAGAEETARRCRAAGPPTPWSPGRTSAGRTRCATSVDEVVRTLGRLDILVNNAGALGAQLNVPLLDLDEIHLAPHDGHAPDRHVPLPEARGAAHGAAALGPGRQHLVGPRPHRRPADARALRRRQGGRHRAHAHRRAGARPARRHGQRRLAGLRRHGAPRQHAPPGAPRARSRSRSRSAASASPRRSPRPWSSSPPTAPRS